jgi:hypothetical protein
MDRTSYYSAKRRREAAVKRSRKRAQAFAVIERTDALFLPAPEGEPRMAADEQRHIDFIESWRRGGGRGYVCPYCGTAHLYGECQYSHPATMSGGFGP